MSEKKRGALGRGLESLLGSEEEIFDLLSPEQKGVPREISVESLSPHSHQPRRSFDETTLAELANSIREKGVLQPILVSPSGKNHYHIVAGERRYRAAKLAGLSTIPAFVRTFSEKERWEVALIENIQRENLSPIDEGKAYLHLMKSFNMNQQDLGKQIGKSRSAIANTIRLLKLPYKIQQALETGVISAGHARALLALPDASSQQILFQKIVGDRLSVRSSEAFTETKNERKRTPPATKPSPDSHVMEMERRLIDLLGTRVSIREKSEKGKIEISFFSFDDLQRIHDILLGPSPEEIEKVSTV